jgi:hypothetical protein
MLGGLKTTLATPLKLAVQPQPPLLLFTEKSHREVTELNLVSNNS